MSARFSYLAALLLLAGSAVGDDSPVIPPDNLVYCTVCHGVQLKGNPVIRAPRLSGMQDWYASRQLHAFSEGRRGTHEGDAFGMEMQPMAAALSAAEIERAVRYVAAVDSELPPVTIEGDADAGRALYGSCAACHGSDGRGNATVGGPALTGLNDWYLARQLRNYKQGIRGSAPGDAPGATMRAAAAVLTDDEAIRNVVTYINHLREPSQ